MDEDIKIVLSHGVSGPPLGIRAADIIERGGRIRRRRKRLAVAGSSLATVAVIVLGAVAVGGRGGEAPAPVEPAGPGLSTVSPAPPSEMPPTTRLAPETEMRPDGRHGTAPAPDTTRPATPVISEPRPPQAERTTTPSSRRPPSTTVPPMSPSTEATDSGDAR